MKTREVILSAFLFGMLIFVVLSAVAGCAPAPTLRGDECLRRYGNIIKVEHCPWILP